MILPQTLCHHPHAHDLRNRSATAALPVILQVPSDAARFSTACESGMQMEACASVLQRHVALCGYSVISRLYILARSFAIYRYSTRLGHRSARLLTSRQIVYP